MLTKIEKGHFEAKISTLEKQVEELTKQRAELEKAVQASLVQNAEGMVPEEYKAQYDQLKQAYTDPAALRAKGLQAAESYIPANFRGQYDLAKKFYSMSPDELSSTMKTSVPGQYHGYFDAAQGAIGKAQELKKAKDEMQIAMFDKAIGPVWGQYDTEGKGFIGKGDVETMAQKALEDAGYAKFYNQTVFDKVFEQIDKKKTEQLTRRQAAELVNLMVFGGM